MTDYHSHDRRRVDDLLDKMLEMYDEIGALKARVREQDKQIALLFKLAEAEGEGDEQGR